MAQPADHTEVSAPVPSSLSTNDETDAIAVSHYFRPFVRPACPWTPYEITKTIFTTLILLPIRFLSFLILSSLAYLVSTVVLLGFDNKPGSEFEVLSAWRRHLLHFLTLLLRLCAIVCFGVFHVHHTRLTPENETTKAFVFVANHLGWLDILVLLATYRSSFVAKGSLENVWLVGKVARAMQCLFVRPNESLTSTLIRRVVETYACHKKRPDCSGCGSCLNPLIIFPEGTTTNGEYMLPFRTGVFNAAMPVKPIALKFPWKRWSPTWESVRFRESLFRTMTQFRNRVEIVELPTYCPNEEERMDAAKYANGVQRVLAKVLELDVVELNRKHKFVYHEWLRGKIEKEEMWRKCEEIYKEDQLLRKRREWRMEEQV